MIRSATQRESTPTRILLLGPQSTGKTTLAHALIDTWSSSTDDPSAPTLIEEVARKVMAKEGFTRDDVETNPAFQTSILLSQLSAESNPAPPYISDRCLIDPLVYTSLHFPGSTLATLLDTAGVAGLLEIYRSSETLMILLEPVAEFWVDDGKRKVVGDEQEWWGVLRGFEKMLDSLGIKGFRRLGEDCKDLDARVKQVHAWMRGE